MQPSGPASPVTVGGSCGCCSGYGSRLGVAICGGGGGRGSSRIASLETHTHTHTPLTGMALRRKQPLYTGDIIWGKKTKTKGFYPIKASLYPKNNYIHQNLEKKKTKSTMCQCETEEETEDNGVSGLLYYH